MANKVKTKKYDDPVLFNRKVRALVIAAFVAVIAGIIITGVITINMIANPELPNFTKITTTNTIVVVTPSLTISMTKP
jgi:hypothetical protein